MELLLAGALIAAVLYAGHKTAKPPSSSAGAPGATPGPSPVPSPSPTPLPAATGPGLYPAGTPGAFPLIVSVAGGDGDCWVDVVPGGSVGPNPGSSRTFWYGPGTWISVKARVQASLGSFLEAFDHFEGPGVSTRSSSFSTRVTGGGYVRGVFSFLGHPG